MPIIRSKIMTNHTPKLFETAANTAALSRLLTGCEGVCVPFFATEEYYRNMR